MAKNKYFRGSWKPIPKNTERGACMVVWKDKFLVFGGTGNWQGVQRYTPAKGNTVYLPCFCFFVLL
jgi:hypothetical protein